MPCRVRFASAPPPSHRRNWLARAGAYLDSDTFFWLKTENWLAFGLKGRFCQPRAKPWEGIIERPFVLKGRFDSKLDRGEPHLQCGPPFLTANPGLRPGLTESALQAEDEPGFSLQQVKSVAVQLLKRGPRRKDAAGSCGVVTETRTSRTPTPSLRCEAIDCIWRAVRRGRSSRS